MSEISIVRYSALTNLTPGETSDVNDAIDAAELNTDYKDLSVHVGVGRFRGSDCEDTGGSGAAQAAFYLRTDSLQHKLGGITAGYHALVCNDVAGDYWEDVVQVDGTGPFLVISDADYKGDGGALPACTGAYTAAFTSWTIYVWPTQPKFSKAYLDLTHDAPGALTGADIAVDPAAATSLHTYTDSHETRLDYHCDAAGALITSVVTNLSLDKDEVMNDEHPMSIAQGGDAEYWVYSYNLPYGIEVLNPAEYGAVPTSYGKETTIVRKGDYSVRMTTSATPQGFKVLLMGDIAAGDITGAGGEQMTISAWVYLPVAGDVIIGFYDNVSADQTATVSVGATTWTKISHTATIGAGAVTVYGVLATGEAGVGFITYVDSWSIWRGDVLWNVDELSQRCHALEHEYSSNAYKNYVPYADFSSIGDASAGTGYVSSAAWLYGVADAPTFWNYDGAPTIAQEVTIYDSGNASMHLHLGVGDSVYHYIGLRDGATPTINPCVKELIEKPFSAGFKIRRAAANREIITLKIICGSAGGGVLSTDTRVIDLGDFTSDKWYWVGITDESVDASAEYIIIGIYNDDAAQVDLYVDYVTGVKGLYPINNAIATGWNFVQETFETAGTVVTASYAGYGQIPSTTVAATPKGIGPNTAMVPISWFGLTTFEDTIVVGAGASDTYALQGVWWDNSGVGAWTATDLGIDVVIATGSTNGMGSDGITRAAGVAQVSDNCYERLSVLQTHNAGMAGTAGANVVISAHGIYWV